MKQGSAENMTIRAVLKELLKDKGIAFSSNTQIKESQTKKSYKKARNVSRAQCNSRRVIDGSIDE